MGGMLKYLWLEVAVDAVATAATAAAVSDVTVKQNYMFCGITNNN